MPEFSGTFSGAPGEDPEEYLEDIDLYVARIVPDQAAAGAAPSPAIVERRTRESRAAFRMGLRGDAREKWYLKLSSANREWATLKDLFRARFRLRTTDRDWTTGAQVHSFTRRPNEAIHDYVKRAVELSYRCNGTQIKDLRDRLFSQMCLGDEDRRLQERVGDRLYNSNKMGADGQLADDATFDDVRDQIVGCSIHPGEESNPFFDEPVSKSKPSEVTVTDQQQFILEAAQTIKALREKLLLDAATPPPMYGSYPHYPPPPMYQPYGPRPYGYGEPMVPQQPMQSHSYMAGQTRENSSRGYEAPPAQRLRATSKDGRAPYRPRQSITCYNCQGPHYSTECDKPMRPYPERAHIAELIRQGKPIPPELKYNDFSGPRVVELQDEYAKTQGRWESEKKPSVTIQEQPKTVVPAAVAFVQPTVTALQANAARGASEQAPKRRHVNVSNDDDLVMMDRSPIEDTIVVGGDTQHRGRSPTPAPVTRQPQQAPQSNLRGAVPEDVAAPKAQRQVPRGERAPAQMERDKSRLRRLKSDLDKRLLNKTQPAASSTGRKDTIPIRAVMGEQRWDVRSWLLQAPVQMNFGQLLDRSPQIRAQLGHLMGLVDSARQGQRRTTRKSVGRTRSLTAKVQVVDRAESPARGASTVLGYLEGYVDQIIVKRCMVDCGSLSELVSPELVRRLGLRRFEVDGRYEVKMADDSTAPVTHYVCFPVVIMGIVSVLRAYVIGNNDTYDLLLSKCWLYRVRAVINYRTNEITMTGTGGHQVTASLLDDEGRPLSIDDGDDDSQDSDDEEEFSADDDVELTYSLLADELATAAELPQSRFSASVTEADDDGRSGDDDGWCDEPSDDCGKSVAHPYSKN